MPPFLIFRGAAALTARQWLVCLYRLIEEEGHAQKVRAEHGLLFNNDTPMDVCNSNNDSRDHHTFPTTNSYEHKCFANS